MNEEGNLCMVIIVARRVLDAGRPSKLYEWHSSLIKVVCEIYSGHSDDLKEEQGRRENSRMWLVPDVDGKGKLSTSS